MPTEALLMACFHLFFFSKFFFNLVYAGIAAKHAVYSFYLRLFSKAATVSNVFFFCNALGPREQVRADTSAQVNDTGQQLQIITAAGKKEKTLF